jgi:hypothetical protein
MKYRIKFMSWLMCLHTQKHGDCSRCGQKSDRNCYHLTVNKWPWKWVFNAVANWPDQGIFVFCVPGYRVQFSSFFILLVSFLYFVNEFMFWRPTKIWPESSDKIVNLHSLDKKFCLNSCRNVVTFVNDLRI